MESQAREKREMLRRLLVEAMELATELDELEIESFCEMALDALPPARRALR